MTDARSVVVARYILAAERHFDLAELAAANGNSKDYERHVNAAMLLSATANKEMLDPDDERAIDRRLRKYVER